MISCPDDAVLLVTDTVVRKLARVIRKVRPDIILTHFRVLLAFFLFSYWLCFSLRLNFSHFNGVRICPIFSNF